MLVSFIDMMNNCNIFGICTGINPYETFFMSVTIQIELQIWIIEKTKGIRILMQMLQRHLIAQNVTTYNGNEKKGYVLF